jgi:DNA transposition AAA+ family ATPase
MKHVEDWITRLGSQSKVAQQCGISVTALSLYMSGKYGADTSRLEKTIASRLNFKDSDWQVVPEIANYRTIEMWFGYCKKEGEWIAISNCAGSGKTQTLEDLFNKDISGSIVYIQAEEWTPRQFLMALAEKTCGVPKKYETMDTLLRDITVYFNKMSDTRPLLVIDEADKLKPSAFRKLIPLYNRTKDRMGCLIAGTGNLKKEIKSGVSRDAKGYDEIDSRLGRSYIDLPGVTEKEVILIAEANGLASHSAALVWESVEKVNKPMRVRSKNGAVAEKMVCVCEDLRRVTRLIKRERLLNASTL